MNPYCWYCDRYVQEEPDHFNKAGECVAQMENHIIEREQFWREALADKPLTDEQMAQVERQIKRHKENPPMPRIDPETGHDKR